MSSSETTSTPTPLLQQRQQEPANAFRFLVVAVAREDERVDAGVDVLVEGALDRRTGTDERDRRTHAGAGEAVPEDVGEPVAARLRPELVLPALALGVRAVRVGAELLAVRRIDGADDLLGGGVRLRVGLAAHDLEARADGDDAAEV